MLPLAKLFDFKPWKPTMQCIIASFHSCYATRHQDSPREVVINIVSNDESRLNIIVGILMLNVFNS